MPGLEAALLHFGVHQQEQQQRKQGTAADELVHTAGCQLPVEMYFPAREYPVPGLEAALQHLGVRCRMLPHHEPTHNCAPGKAQTQAARLAGFSMKIQALLLSSFREVSNE